MDPAHLSIALALAAAAGAGTADYLAAHASRHKPAIAVAAWVQAFGLVLILAAAMVSDWPQLGRSDLLLSLVAGICIAMGLAGLYGALAIGPIGITAPIAAVVGAAIPVVVDIGSGRALAPLQQAGLVFGLVAVILLSVAPVDSSAGSLKRGIAYALVGGAGIGAFTLALDATSADAGLWGLAIARALAVLVLALAVSTLRLQSTGSSDWKRLIGAGLLDGSAMMAFLFALRTGHLALVAVVTALYPAFTVALAMLVDRERMLRTQAAGIAIAVAAIVLISWAG